MIFIKRAIVVAAICSAGASLIHAQRPDQLGPGVRQFVTVDQPVVALTHARVVDGTGAAPQQDQTIVIRNGAIASVGPSGSAQVPSDARVIDLSGATVIPGLVMMHEHLFYPTGGIPLYSEQAFSFPRMYLAGGVTTMRTAGSMEPYTDINVRRMIETGVAPGPHIDVTGPYLEHSNLFYQVHPLDGPDDARSMVAYWADHGATSFKMYMNVTRAEMAAAVAEAHKRGLKVTGHLCSVTFREAAELGLDDLEHGFVVASDFVPDKKPDTCPPMGVTPSLANVEIASEPVQSLIRELVSKHVALTSTLTVFETFVPNRPTISQRALDMMTSDAQRAYLASRARVGEAPSSPWTSLFKKEMDFERAFAKAGGLLLAGTDPTGFGGVVAGYSDQRMIELLVEAGFTPVEAIQICTQNGAKYLGRTDRIGTIAPGKAADLVVIRGDPTTRVADIEKVETVFKDGVGYDSAKLFAAARGIVGLK